MTAVRAKGAGANSTTGCIVKSSVKFLSVNGIVVETNGMPDLEITNKLPIGTYLVLQIAAMTLVGNRVMV